MTSKDQLLEELREALKEPREEQTASVTLSSGIYPPTGGYYTNNITTANPTSITNGGYTLTSTGTSTPIWTSTPFSNGTGTNTHMAGRLNLEGDKADVVINGKSLSQTLEALEERLNILNPNPELEKEWSELKELGDRYRKLEADLKEKSEMWAKLKKTNPPVNY